jgi:transposase-like protein
MGNQRFTLEFKDEAVRQVIERGHPVTEVAVRLGISRHSLYRGGSRSSNRLPRGGKGRFMGAYGCARLPKPTGPGFADSHSISSP